MELCEESIKLALNVTYPIFKSIANSVGLHEAYLWIYRVDGTFDQICENITIKERDEVRNRTRGQYYLENLQVNYVEDVVNNRLRPQLFD